MLKEQFSQMYKFCVQQNISMTTLLTAFQYLKIHIGKQLSNGGSFQSMQELYMIRVDAFIALRLAMKMCDSRPCFLPKWWQISQEQQTQNSQDTCD